MGDPGQDSFPEVGEDRREGLPLLRRLLGEGAQDLPGPDPRFHRVVPDSLQVVRHPVHKPVGLAPEFLEIHFATSHFRADYLPGFSVPLPISEASSFQGFHLDLFFFEISSLADRGDQSLVWS